jgi:Protein of unknown function, DUF488
MQRKSTNGSRKSPRAQHYENGSLTIRANGKSSKKRYRAELKKHRETIEDLAREGRKSTVTLLFAAKNTEYNNAVALKEYLEQFT